MSAAKALPAATSEKVEGPTGLVTVNRMFSFVDSPLPQSSTTPL